MLKKPKLKNKEFSLADENSKILLVGAGKMGQALLFGWLKNGFNPKNILVIEPNQQARNFIIKNKICSSADFKRIKNFLPDIIILAVKPGSIYEVLPDYREFNKALFISIAAGITIKYLKKQLGKNAKIIRAMPNLPATIGEGATALCCEKIGIKDKNIAAKFFGAVGKTVQVNERDMDVVTALSGSGPAYIFYLAECLIEAAGTLGLDKKVAESLVLQTLRGSALLAFNSEKSVQILREEVTSPGGTTAAALTVLNKNSHFKGLIKEAIIAAAKRAKELEK